MVKYWSKTKKIKSVIENVRNKNGGARASRAPPHFWLYLFSYTFDFFGFGPIFDQFFWDFILKNNSKYKEKPIKTYKTL